MEDVSKLQEKELIALSDDEVFDLETLITDGADAKIPITIKFPTSEGKVVKAAAMIRPLTSIEWNNCVKLNRSKNDKSNNEVDLLEKALYTKDGKQFPKDLIKKIPAGVVLEIVNEISRISGIDTEQNIKLAKEMMGFSI